MSSIWRRQWHPTPVLLPGKSHGRRSLVGCSPWGPTESDTTEQLHFHFSLSYIGEGNGNPLQCSCLENPGMGEPVGLPAIYGVAQSRTRLKRLSNSVCLLLVSAFLFETYVLFGRHTMQETACNAEDMGSIPGSQRSLVEGNGNPLWYSCMKNHMDREA